MTVHEVAVLNDDDDDESPGSVWDKAIRTAWKNTAKWQVSTGSRSLSATVPVTQRHVTVRFPEDFHTDTSVKPHIKFLDSASMPLLSQPLNREVRDGDVVTLVAPRLDTPDESIARLGRGVTGALWAAIRPLANSWRVWYANGHRCSGHLSLNRREYRVWQGATDAAREVYWTLYDEAGDELLRAPVEGDVRRGTIVRLELPGDDAGPVYRNGTVAVFTEDDGELQVAIRRDYGWSDGEWQVATHGFRRVPDEFIAERGTVVYPPEERTQRAELTFSEFSTLNRERASHWHDADLLDGDWTLADWSNAMQGEAGEAGNVVKKMRRIELGAQQAEYQDWDEDSTRGDLLARLWKEIGDTAVYLDLLAQAVGQNLGFCVALAFNRTSVKEDLPQRLRWATEEEEENEA